MKHARRPARVSWVLLTTTFAHKSVNPCLFSDRLTLLHHRAIRALPFLSGLARHKLPLHCLIQCPGAFLNEGPGTLLIPHLNLLLHDAVVGAVFVVGPALGDVDHPQVLDGNLGLQLVALEHEGVQVDLGLVVTVGQALDVVVEPLCSN